MLADHLMAPVADRVFGAAERAGFVDAWIGTLAFSAQIFFDFAGYSTCAIGIALCLGFVLPTNFKFPYAAIGFADFWQRWHVSLSSWLRDYLYISLGGNRKGTRRTYGNLMFTMLLGGLWHGASWMFVVWGGLHGIYLICELFLQRLYRRVGEPRFFHNWYAKIALALFTYYLVCITWVFFRAEDFSTAAKLVTTMFVGAPGSLYLGLENAVIVAGVTILLLASHWMMRDSSLEDRWRALPWWGRSTVLACLLFVLAITPGENRAFIYFQF